MQLNIQIDFLNNVNELFNNISNTIKMDMNIDINMFSSKDQIDLEDIESYLSKYNNNINLKEIY